MIPRTKRVGKKDFPPFTTKGRSFSTPLFSCKIVSGKDAGATNRYAVVVSKKVAKSAVVRNTLKRRFFNAIRGTKGFTSKGSTGIFYVRTPAVLASYRDIADEVEKILS